ncbi:MAG: DsbA family oxidoreductase [Nitrospira sp.]|nr:DsbA family oxidoreductase [Nitrospira sp.]
MITRPVGWGTFHDGNPVLIEVYSDVICPWCYVGKRRLERTLDQLTGTVVTRVQWRPFQLNPWMPLEGMDRIAYLEAKFGSRDTYRRLQEEVQAAEKDIPFAFEKITVTPNTLAAHRLIGYAETYGKQDAMVETLFHFYFVEGRDIGRDETLIEAAGQVGLDPHEAEAFLKSNEGLDDVTRAEAAGRSLGIRAVPCFVVNRESILVGAQPMETLGDAIVGASQRGAAEAMGKAKERVHGEG